MISLLQVVGQSMEPFCQAGDFVLSNRVSYLFSRPKIGQAVVVRDPSYPKRLLLKRIAAIQEKDGGVYYWLKGDNKKASYDSRLFGWIGQKALLGPAKVIHRTSSFGGDILV